MLKRTLLAALLTVTAAAAVASPHDTEKTTMKPHISMTDARAIALKTMPGKIAKEELEKERGGSGLRYSFDIVAKGVTHEIGVDANDGTILENSIDNDND